MSSNNPTFGRRLAVGLILGTTLGLAACASGPPPGPVALLPTEKYQIQVTNRPEQMALGPHRDGLSPTQKAAIGQFVAEWRDNGGGPVSVRVPTVGDQHTAQLMAGAAAAYVHAMGVPSELVRMDSYAPPPGAPPVGAPTLLVYDRFEAQGPNCSGGWSNLTSTFSNSVYDKFGCSVTANIAAMVANPRDLLVPAVTMPADASRREVVIGKYRNGEQTSTVADQQASGKVSDTAQ